MVVRARPSLWTVVGRTILDLFYPIACVGCGHVGDTARPPAEQWLCARCRDRIVPDRATCLVCGARSPSGRTCHPCRDQTPLAGTLAVGPYRDPVLHDTVKHLKFQGVRALADPLGELLARRLMAAGSIEPDRTILVPIPLYRRRQRQRGFNQARVLADAAGKQLDLPVVDLLERRRATAPQTSILGTGPVRATNVSAAFRCREDRCPPAGTQVILVDDVLTSGATITSAARALAPLRPAEIWAAVVARG